MKDEIDAAADTLPGLSSDLSEFRAFAAPLLGQDVNLPDLLLSWASLRKDRAALAELDRRLERTAASALSKYQDLAHEILQEVREKLLVGPKAKLRAYNGRGALVRYLRAVLTTTAIDKLRERQAATPGRQSDDDSLSTIASAEASAESRLFNARAKAAFAAAFKQALTRLTQQERMILRMKFVDDLSVEDVGSAFGVHRTTALRWLEKIRREVLAETRAVLQSKFQVADGELDGFMSEMELSVGERLSVLLPAMKK